MPNKKMEILHLQWCLSIPQEGAAPLSTLTEGVHIHHVRFHNSDAFARCCRALTERGMLLSTEAD